MLHRYEREGAVHWLMQCNDAEQLSRAANEEDLEEVRRLLEEEGVDVNATDKASEWQRCVVDWWTEADNNATRKDPPRWSVR